MVCSSQGTLDSLVQTIKVGLRFGEWSLIGKIRKHFFQFFFAFILLSVFKKLMKGKRKRKKSKNTQDT